MFCECGTRSRPSRLRLSMVSTVGIKSQGTSGGGRRRGFHDRCPLLGQFLMEPGREWLAMGGWTGSIVASGLWSAAPTG
jgi:hypothetical protein